MNFATIASLVLLLFCLIICILCSLSVKSVLNCILDPIGCLFGGDTGVLADCPAGYKNTGTGCLRPADTQGGDAGVVADCPEGSVNTGASCYVTPDTYGKGCCCTVFGCCHNCKPGYTDNGCTCGKGGGTTGMDTMICPPKNYPDYTHKDGARCYKPCPPGYTNTGVSCYRGPDTIVGFDQMTCNDPNYPVKKGDRCYKSQ